MFTAIKVKILRQGNLVEEYELSLHGGEITDKDVEFHFRLLLFAAGKLDTITDITEIQSFLTHSGYSLSNVILLEVSPLYETEISMVDL